MRRTAARAPGRDRAWRRARPAYLATAILGGLHALSSLYWGVGGRALLDTIGEGAVALREAAPWWLFPMLILVGVAKLAGVAVPIANARGLLPRPRVWRILSWAGAIGLIVYGGAYMLMAELALAGGFGEVDDRRGLEGHAWIWDPLFLAWGLALVIALPLDRPAPGRRDAAHG